MNAKLNAIVSGISTKIKEQEEERVAQDKENLALRAELQVPEAFAFLDLPSPPPGSARFHLFSRRTGRT